MMHMDTPGAGKYRSAPVVHIYGANECESRGIFSVIRGVAVMDHIQRRRSKSFAPQLKP